MTVLRGFIAVATLLAGCGVVPPAPLVGVIDSSAEVGGAACPLLVTGTDGARWEVTIAQPYTMSEEPDGRVVLWGPEGPLGRTGERIRIVGRPSSSPPSACRWGTPLVAEAITPAR